MLLFYDGPKPPESFYDDLLSLPNSDMGIIEGDFLKFLSSIDIPARGER